jgi:single-stranded DNA-binding protein
MHRNEIVVVGRLSMEPTDRQLPSGSLLTQWRLAVRRPVGHPSHQRADALDCVTFNDDVRQAVEAWRLDDVVEIEGAVRRRWWRGGSRYEIEVSTARTVKRRTSAELATSPESLIPDVSPRALSVPTETPTPAASQPAEASPATPAPDGHPQGTEKQMEGQGQGAMPDVEATEPVVLISDAPSP